jgi:DNA-binding Xre family transcriptional regulator
MPSVALTKPAIITTAKGERLAVIPEAHYRRLAELAEDAADIAAARRAERRLAEGKDELIPFEMSKRLRRGANPVRVWREHRGLKLQDLAKKAGIKPAFLSQIETGTREGSVATLKALARSLNVAVDDLLR